MKHFILIAMSLSSIGFYGQTAKDYFTSGFDKCFKRNWSEAIKDFDKAIELDTTYIDAYYRRAQAKIKLKDYNGGIKDYDKIIKLFPQKIYIERGIVKRKIGDLEGACSDFKIASELGYTDAKKELILYCNYTPKTAEEFYYRAEMGDTLNWKAKIEDCTKAIELNPKFIPAYYLRALGKNVLRDKEGACLDWKKILELADENDGFRKMNNNFCK